MVRVSALNFLKCPDDGGDLAFNTEPDGEEVRDGALVCTRCDRAFRVDHGVPVMLDAVAADSHVAESFGFEWDRFHRGDFEADTVFGLSREEDLESFFVGLSITPEMLEGAIVLDAGCGSGRLTVDLATRFPNTTFVGFDLNPAIEHVFEKGRRLDNLHAVRGSVFDLPFADETFDFVWSNGVIHHTGDTKRAFDSLTKKVKQGGRLYVWVYESKPSPLVMLREALVRVRLRPWNWDRRALYAFCWLISMPTWLVVKLMAPLRRSGRVGRASRLGVLSRDRGLRELVLTWFDVLSPKYRDTYSESEFEAWFEAAGFAERSRYWWPVGISGTRT